MDDSFQLTHCRWQETSEVLTAVRRIVFIAEQHVPEELELDELDRVCHHVLVTDTDGKPVATGRMDKDGRIGQPTTSTLPLQRNVPTVSSNS